MPAKDQPSSRAAVALLLFLVLPCTTGSARPALVHGFQAEQASALDRALRAGDLDEARRLVPENWAASEQLFVSYLERAFLSPDSLQPASESRLLASRLADVFFLIVEYDFARSVVSTLDTADMATRQSLIAAVRDYFSALERLRATYGPIDSASSASATVKAQEQWPLMVRTFTAIADRFRALSFPRGELHTMGTFADIVGGPSPRRLNLVADRLGDELSLARKLPRTEASLAMAERLGLPKLQCSILQTLGTAWAAPTDQAKLEHASRYLERARVLWRGIPAREMVNHWLDPSAAPKPSTVTLPALWSAYRRLNRPADDVQAVLAEALGVSRPFGEAAVLATLSAFALRGASLGEDAAESVLEASRAFGPKAELWAMRRLSGSGARFRPDVAERALELGVGIADSHERAVTLEWYARNRSATRKCGPLPPAYEQLLQLCLKSDETDLVADALAGAADCQLTQGDAASALGTYNQAVQLAERAGHLDKAAQVARLATVIRPNLSFPPAVRFDLATRAIANAREAGDALELARAFLARSQARIGATHQSFDDVREALAASERYTAQSGSPMEELDCLNALAQELAMRGEFRAAVDTQLRRAETSRGFELPSQVTHEVRAYEELVSLYSTKMGEPALALEAADQVRKLLEATMVGGDPPASPVQIGEAYFRLGQLASTLGQSVTALDYWDRALSKITEGAPRPLPAASDTSSAQAWRRRVLTGRAALYSSLGDFDASLRDWNDVSALIAQTKGTYASSETIQRAALMTEMAWTQALAGSPDKALALVRDAIALSQQDTSKSWPGARMIGRQLDILLLTNNPQEAVAFCDALYESARRESIVHPLVERWYLENLARAHARAGEFDKARSLLLSAIEIDRSHPTVEAGGLSGSLLALGLLEIDAGDFARAREHLLAARAAVNPYDVDQMWRIERALAMAHVRLGEDDAALVHYDAALTTLEGGRERMRAEEFRLRHGFDRSRLYEDHAALLAAKAVRSRQPADAESAFQAAERKRTQSLWDLLATGWSRVPPAAMPDQIHRTLDMEARIGAKQALLREQFGQPADKRNAALVDALQRDLKLLQVDHARLLTTLAQGQYRYAAPAALASSLAKPVRAALGPSRLLVEYLVADDRSYAFVVSGSGVKVVPVAVGRDRLRQQVEGLLRPFRQLRTGGLDLARLPYDTRAAFDLYQTIFGPVRPALGGASDIVIVPDDVLTFLPFDALVDTAPRGSMRGQVLHAEFANENFLVHRYAISYLSSSAQLIAGASEAGRPSQMPKKLFAMANPAAGRTVPAPPASLDDPLKRQLRSGAFDAFLAPLPGAEAEVQRVARHFPPDASTIVRGAEATEAAYESQAGQYSIVHFATHAVASDGQPFYSTMILAPDSAPGHDGFLQAFEVLRTPLQADLVVLSGCETAMGAEDLGQGLVGLVAAFQQAGARSVLATLWSIDEATAEVMAGFYGAMARGTSTPAALRQAKLQMLQKRLRMGTTEVSLAHPFFWAPFILAGPPADR